MTKINASLTEWYLSPDARGFEQMSDVVVKNLIGGKKAKTPCIDAKDAVDSRPNFIRIRTFWQTSFQASWGTVYCLASDKLRAFPLDSFKAWANALKTNRGRGVPNGLSKSVGPESTCHTGHAIPHALLFLGASTQENCAKTSG